MIAIGLPFIRFDYLRRFLARYCFPLASRLIRLQRALHRQIMEAFPLG
jgi:hypothetical protein